MDKDKNTILIVEDNPIMRKALRETLKLLNYNALEAENGVKALEIIEAAINNGSSNLIDDISLILSDLSMPEMDGEELYYELKKRNINIPVIMLTGDAASQELDRLRQDGLSGWLIKPVDIDQIAKMLDQILD